ncbi:hypothetical protein LWI28_006790 [Acer negundo]|uniref:Uncharacterized protein n=1 Tax=Acer negundo TaxID=4023 RepID=A0AAD5IDB5_ACENE|nr:hypothetical protein LWI28_006790 [Acer negundo]
MATLQKFKLLATQCAVSSSPTRSPTASPVIHLRRRKTLRMLLNRRRFHRQDDDALDREAADVSPEIKNKKIRAKLKDLFVSSPPFEERDSESSEVREGLLPVNGRIGGGGGGSTSRRGSNGSLRPISATFRYRLLRRAWRPVLVSIPE